MSSTSNRKNSNNSQSPDDERIAELIWTLVKAAGHLFWWAILFPGLSIPIIACAAMGITYGGQGRTDQRLGVHRRVCGVGVAVDTASFQRVGGRAGAAAVADLVALHPPLGIGLHPARPHRQTRRTHPRPEIAVGSDRRARPTCCRLRVVTGQSVADWQKQAEALAAAWRADRLTIRATTPGELRMTVMRGDVLAQPIACPCLHPRRPWIWRRCGWG